MSRKPPTDPVLAALKELIRALARQAEREDWEASKRKNAQNEGHDEEVQLNLDLEAGKKVKPRKPRT